MKKIRQCKSKWWTKQQCQGAIGHENWHWYYDGGGSLNRWWSRGLLPRIPHIGASMTPPGHADYVSPEKMRKWYWICLEGKHYRKQKRK